MVTKHNRSLLEGLARLGYLAKSAVYLLIGVLAATAAFQGSNPQGSQGALHSVLSQPYGKGLLAAIGFGLLGYAVWKIVQAVQDTEFKGSDASGLVQRSGYFLSGLAHGGLALYCARQVTSGGQGNQSSLSSNSAGILSTPGGQWILGAVGVVLICFALFRLSMAWNKTFKSKLRLDEMSSHEREVAVRAGVFGIAARAVVFSITGFFFLKAAMTSDAAEVGATQDVLQLVGRQGTWYLATLAFGLLAYAVFQAFMARYRTIQTA